MRHRELPIRRLASLALVSALALAACASGESASVAPTVSPVPIPSQELLGPFPSAEVGALLTDPDVFYTDVVECGSSTPCRVPLDVLAPADGHGLPTIVLFNGGGKLFPERRYQAPLAVALAERGAVVFLTAYRGITTMNSDQDSVSDARCAVRYARAHTAEYGGDPNRLLVVGHSQGGFLGIDIATHPEEEAEGCLADGSAIPDGVVGLGSPRPSLRGVTDSGPPIWLYSGSEDTVGHADRYSQALRDAGFDATGEVFEGVTHDQITDPAAVPEIVDRIMQAADSL
jgi:acetyl esterase/lipase